MAASEPTTTSGTSSATLAELTRPSGGSRWIPRRSSYKARRSTSSGKLSYSNGQQRQTYILRTPSTVLTAVLAADDRLLMVWRQQASRSWSWELPSGIVKGGEDLAVAAARTTRAPTGVRPKRLRHLMGYQPLADIADARQELFTAWAAAKTPIRTDVRNECVPDWIELSELPGLTEDKKLVGGASLFLALALFVRGSSEIPKSLKWVKIFCAA